MSFLKSKRFDNFLIGFAIFTIIVIILFLITVNFQLNEFKKMNCTNEEVTLISQYPKSDMFIYSQYNVETTGLFMKIKQKDNLIKTYLFSDKSEPLEELKEGDKFGLFWCDYEGKRVIRGLNLTN